METKRLQLSSTKQERINTHRVKMLAKKHVRQKMYEDMSGPNYIQANLGVNHPDYGLTIEEHLVEKAARAQQGN